MCKKKYNFSKEKLHFEETKMCDFAMMQLGESVPFAIGGFINTADFAPAA